MERESRARDRRHRNYHSIRLRECDKMYQKIVKLEKKLWQYKIDNDFLSDSDYDTFFHSDCNAVMIQFHRAAVMNQDSRSVSACFVVFAHTTDFSRIRRTTGSDQDRRNTVIFVDLNDFKGLGHPPIAVGIVHLHRHPVAK